jgi:hypothetical protein
MGTLYAMTGGRLYLIAVLTSDPDTGDKRRSASIELAKLAIPRLP